MLDSRARSLEFRAYLCPPQILVLDEGLLAKRDELARTAAGLEEALRRPTPHGTAALAVKALRSAMLPVAAEALYRGRPEPEQVRSDNR